MAVAIPTGFSRSGSTPPPSIFKRNPADRRRKRDHRTRGNVVVVDDDPLVREALHDVLSDEGYAVVAVADANQAVVRMREVAPPRVAIVDLMMPGLDGWDLIERIKNDDGARMPVIVFTGRGRAPVKGSEQVMAKPCDIESLLKLIEEYCR